jgi:DeoR family transcriptional regulator of aga operon
MSMPDAKQPGTLPRNAAASRPPLATRLDKLENRLEAVQNILQQSGTVSVEDLSNQMAVSVVTIRRDLQVLEQRGLLRRTHGGAESLQRLFYEPFRDDRSFQAQVGSFAEEKRRIGRAAAALIQPGETIALTPGTTTTEVIRSLPLNHNITVVTNTVNVAMELSTRKDIHVFVTGGHLRGDWFSLVGPTATQSLKGVVISVLFIGADGFDPRWGPTCYSSDEADLNGTMAKHARRRIAVVDHSKFAIAAAWRICPAQDLDLIITDTGASNETIEPFQKLGIEVLRI